MSQISPGPWERDGTLLIGHLEIDIRLGETGDNWITVKGSDGATVEANAAAVVALPDLLAACEAARETLEFYVPQQTVILGQLRAAVARAKGEE